MEGPQKRIESHEAYKELVGKITVFRHGDTHYTNQYPDLTDEGIWKLTEAGKALGGEVDEESEDLIFLHSPSTRAKASMAYLLQGMEKTASADEAAVEEIARPLNALRSVKTLNHEEALKMIGQHVDFESPTLDQYVEFDRAYALHDDYENSPHWEPRSKGEKRSSRLLRQTLLMLVKNHPENDSGKTPHIVAVSHFETLNHLAVKIFNLDMEKDPLYARGEKMTFEVLASPEDAKKLLLRCGFRGEEKRVWFDIEKGEISPI